MRVLQLITRSELGGSQRYVAELARRQRACGFDVELAAGTTGWLSEQQDCFSRVHYLPDLVREIHPRRDSAAFLALLRFVRRGGYDVVHTHVSKAGILGRLAARLAEVPIVAHTSHGFILTEALSPARRAVYWTAEQLAALVTDRLFAVSETDRAVLRRNLRTRPGALRVMTIVPSYVRELPPAWRLSDENRYELVAIGNLYFNKGYDVLLPALAAVARRHPRVRLTVYGDGPERDALETLVARLGLEERVRLAGRNGEIVRHIAESGMFVMPSRKEGLPLALLEAMATAAPIVATDVGALREVMGPEAVLARPGQSNDLARIIDELLSSDQRRIAVAGEGRLSFERLLPSDDPNAAAIMYA